MNLRRKIMALTLSVLGCVCILGSTVNAATDTSEKKAPVDMREGSLTVRTFETKADGGKAVNGVRISAYRIAEIDENGEYTAASAFSDVLKDAGFGDLSGLDLTSTDANSALRKALADHIRSDGAGIEAAAEGETANGEVKFDFGADQLGLYFVQGGLIEGYFDGSVDGQNGKLSYIPDTALVSIPSPPNSELGTEYWDHLPTVNLKYTKGGLWTDPPVLKSVKVLKGSLSESRDFRFVMQAVGDAPLPDGEKVGGDGSRYLEMTYPSELAEITDSSGKVTKEGRSKEFGVIWLTTPGLYEYLIFEVQETASYYTFDKTSYRLYVDVELAEDGTLTGTQWYETIEDGVTTEVSEKTPAGPGAESVFRFTNLYSRSAGGGGGSGGGGGGSSGGHSVPTPVQNVSEPSVPELPESPEVIPQVLPKTGMLWWPVPILAAAGIVLFAAGYILERKN